MACRALAILERLAGKSLVHLTLYVLMTFKAKRFFIFNYKMLYIPTVCKVAISTYAVPESAMHSGFLGKVPDFLMAAKAKGIKLIIHQSLHITHM